MPVSLGSMSGADLEGEEMVCGAGWTDCVALWAWTMRDLAMARAVSRPCGCLKTSDRSTGRSRRSEGQSTGRPGGIVVVARSLERRGGLRARETSSDRRSTPAKGTRT